MLVYRRVTDIESRKYPLMIHESMNDIYLPTKLGDFVRANVGTYSSTMEHMGNAVTW